jgi:1,4-dihydroxy-2-naphthoyl-CoA synthase
MLEHSASFAGLSVISYDKMQWFLLALLWKEITPKNANEMALLVAKQTAVLMEHMGTKNVVNFTAFLSYLSK